MPAPITSKYFVNQLSTKTPSSGKALWVGLACIAVIGIGFAIYWAARPSKPKAKPKAAQASLSNDSKEVVTQKLIDAIRLCDSEGVRDLLKSEVLGSAIKDSNGKPIIFIALDAFFKDLPQEHANSTWLTKWKDTFKALISEPRVEVNVVNARGALLHTAIKPIEILPGRCYTLAFLLDSLLKREDLDVNISYEGKTPLELAVANDELGNKIQELLDKGADPEQDKSLFEAIKRNRKSTIKLLGARVSDAKRKEAFYSGFRESATEESSLLALLDGGKVDMNTEDTDGCTPLFSIIRRASSQNKEPIVLALVLNGADMTQQYQGKTAGQIIEDTLGKAFKELLTAHERGQNLFHWLAKWGTSNDFLTAFKSAFPEKYKELSQGSIQGVVSWLKEVFKVGDLINAADENGKKPLDIADSTTVKDDRKNAHQVVIELLQACGAEGSMNNPSRRMERVGCSADVRGHER